MSERQERFPRVNAMAREEGWGTVTDAALGILPEDVESQARVVARWAAARIEELEAALDAGEKDAGLSEHGGMWRFWSRKAMKACQLANAAEARLLEIAEAAFYEGFAGGRDGNWVEGDPSYAWKKSEVYTKVGKLK